MVRKIMVLFKFSKRNGGCCGEKWCGSLNGDWSGINKFIKYKNNTNYYITIILN